MNDTTITSTDDHGNSSNTRPGLEQILVMTLSSEKHLNIALNLSESFTLDFFRHEISRNPENIRRHMQRINYIITLGQQLLLFGAIIDLFIVLKDKGVALKQRILRLSNPVLDKQHFLFLKKHLTKPLSKRDKLPNDSCSILTSGLSGSYKLVQRFKINEKQNNDIIFTVIHELNQGKTDQALSMLEDAINAEPERVMLHQLLLRLYRKTANLERFNKIYLGLYHASMPLKQQWIDTKRYLQRLQQ